MPGKKRSSFRNRRKLRKGLGVRCFTVRKECTECGTEFSFTMNERGQTVALVQQFAGAMCDVCSAKEMKRQEEENSKETEPKDKKEDEDKAEPAE